jgi:hypothetical protein
MEKWGETNAIPQGLWMSYQSMEKNTNKLLDRVHKDILFRCKLVSIHKEKYCSNNTLLEPKVLGSVLCAHTNRVVHVYSIVFLSPKEMREEFHKVRIKPSFVNITPSINTIKCASVQVFLVAPDCKKIPFKSRNESSRNIPE